MHRSSLLIVLIPINSIFSHLWKAPAQSARGTASNVSRIYIITQACHLCLRLRSFLASVHYAFQSSSMLSTWYHVKPITKQSSVFFDHALRTLGPGTHRSKWTIFAAGTHCICPRPHGSLNIDFQWMQIWFFVSSVVRSPCEPVYALDSQYISRK